MINSQEIFDSMNEVELKSFAIAKKELLRSNFFDKLFESKEKKLLSVARQLGNVPLDPATNEQMRNESVEWVICKRIFDSIFSDS